MRKLPTSLLRCDPMRDELACGLLQMEYTVPPEILYSNYWYRSGTNETMRTQLAGVVHSALEMLDTPPQTVLDIGCNDGTLLGNYEDSVIKIGIDPSDVKIASPLQNFSLVRDIFPSEELAKVLEERKLDVISSIAMFYDLESPTAFAKAIAKALAEDGIWVFEMSYMPTMLASCMYDTICHEHLEYYSLAVIEYILKMADMKIVRADLNDSNGGSIRCFATHTTNFKHKSAANIQGIEALRRSEFDLALDSDFPYNHFQERINVHRQELGRMIWDLKRANKRIHVYGASTKGNTILQWCGLDNRAIDCAAERNPEKYGTKTLGTDIPIVSEADSRNMKPDYYLVLPWHFRKEILIRERETLSSGISFIFPLPQIELVHAHA
jgi:SAM-dependent methyltransferase